MNEKQLRKLSRLELLELLVAKSQEVDQLKAELDEANAKLASRKIQLEETGDIAKAALALNGVFEAAQAAADQYLENIQMIYQMQAARIQPCPPQADPSAKQNLKDEEAGNAEAAKDAKEAKAAAASAAAVPAAKPIPAQRTNLQEQDAKGTQTAQSFQSSQSIESNPTLPDETSADTNQKKGSNEEQTGKSDQTKKTEGPDNQEN